jgi:prepilin-type processing-associated H-X9-DG protein
MAFRLYADENNDTIPPVSNGPNAYWNHYLGRAGYLGSAETFGSQSYQRWNVLRCPGEQAPRQSGVTKPYYDYDYNGCSYSLNWSLSGYTVLGRHHFSMAPDYVPGGPWSFPDRYAQSASDASFVMDCQDVSPYGSVPNWFHDALDWENNWDWTGNSWSGYYHAFRHPGRRANMLYVDGHVASIKHIIDGGGPNWTYLFNYPP